MRQLHKVTWCEQGSGGDSGAAVTPGGDSKVNCATGLDDGGGGIWAAVRSQTLV